MMIFREKQKIISCVIAVVMVAGFVLFRYLPLRRRINAAQQKLAAQKLTIETGAVHSQQSQVLKAQSDQLRRTIGNYEQRIPGDRAIGVFLHKMASLMNDYNLQEQLIEPGKEIEAGQLNCIPLKIQCKGELKQIFEFYSQIQQLDRLIRIEQVKLKNNKDFNGPVTMETNAVIYYKPNKIKS